ncbi:MAG TPA: 5-(carboxyamino)imidazole ribonucleotide synthase [Xanthobacteraceae bacterium]|nr:5-(carboxyamino)imidazole ribonucleotide synthase [Xanthobacteraceae bacterium]
MAELPVLAPAATIGILGGGQLGRMLAQAAAKLGLRAHVFAPDADSCAFAVAHAHTVAAYDDEAALARFAAAVDLATYEFENIPAATARFIATRKPVLPDPKVLETTQDRLAEKKFVNRLGIGTAQFAEVNSEADLKAAIDKIGVPAVLKTRRLGYDGKGQAAIRAAGEATAAWRAVGAQPSILEGFIDFAREISVVAARGCTGEFVAYEPIENDHRNHILHHSRVPAAISPALADEAIAIAKKIADSLGYVGVIAVEMFVTRDGRLLVNELAPRVHNSGHWTLDGASVSQFEQHLRAISGWPLAHPRRLGKVEMTNLIGDEVNSAPRSAPGVAVHLYGKREARPGRKMGHVTRLWPE